MKSIVPILLCCIALTGYCQAEGKGSSPPSIRGYYTRLAFKDGLVSETYGFNRVPEAMIRAVGKDRVIKVQVES